MDKLIIYCDIDGVLTRPYKIWREDIILGQVSIDPLEHANPTDTRLHVSKLISDHDSHAITLVRDHLVFISGDARVNRAYAKRQRVPYICVDKRHEDKWGFLVEHWQQNIDSESSPQGRYVYVGDSLPDYFCLRAAKLAFVPADASQLLLHKLKHNKVEFVQVNRRGGEGVLEAVICELIERGMLAL